MSLVACGGSESSSATTAEVNNSAAAPAKLNVTVTPHFAALYRQSITASDGVVDGVNAVSTSTHVAAVKRAGVKIAGLNTVAIDAAAVDLVVSEDTRFDG